MREEILKITMTVDDEKIIGSTTDQVRGPRGYSAYEVAVLLGFVGDEEAWLESLRGDQGRSAYRVAVDEGFVGTVSEWRDSLIGPRGPIYDDSDLREQIDLELASLTRIASEAADVATTKAGEAVDAKNIVVLRADEVDGHAVILYGLFDEIEDYRQEVYRRALESVEQAGIATTKAGEAVISAGEADQSAQAAAQSASEAEQTLNDKVSKSDIVQTKGQSSTSIMSQKAVTDLFNNLVPWLNSEIPAGDAVFDFEKNRYAVKGVPVGLTDVSEFIRLSSATLWQDGQLFEVSNNVPRIGGEGLLIEPQRTNNFVGDLLGGNYAQNYQNTTLTYFGTSLSSPYYELQAIEDGGVGGSHTGFNLTPSEQDYTISAAILKVGMSVSITTLRTGGGINGVSSLLTTATDVVEVSSFNPTILIGGGYTPIDDTRGVLWVSRGPVDTNNGANHYQVTALGLSKGEVLDVYAPQAENGFRVTSYIPTDVAPATRAPDILNIPLLPSQTISGDWDEGVTYEVADNIATFTGHGYIRNITVEAL